MYEKFKKHITYYFFLLLILLSGLTLTFLAAPRLALQTLIVFVTVVFYIILGISHHFINHDLTVKIMVEYVLIGLFGISIVFFMLMGGII